MTEPEIDAEPGAEPEPVCASAPGVFNLIGEHPDEHGGFVLPTPIPRRTYVELHLRDDDQVRVWSREAGEWGEYRLGEERRRGVWLDYVMGCTHALRTAGHALRGAELRIHSELPLGSGLASSAALELAVLRAMRAAFALDLDDLELALLGQRAETEFVGAPVGPADSLCASLCEPGVALLIDTRTLALRTIPLPRDLELLVIDSGVAHEHAGGSRTRRAECDEAARRLGVSALSELGPEQLGRVAALPEPLARRARHVISENQRVLAAAAALEADDRPTLGRLFAESHASLRDDFGVSIPALDQLVELAREDPAVFAARMTGGGGSIIALARAGAAVEAGARIVVRYAMQTDEVARVLEPGVALATAQPRA